MVKHVLTHEWVDHFFVQVSWGTGDQSDQLGNAFLATAKTVVASAALRSDDPMRIARFLGIPITYTSAVLHNLNRYGQWIEATYSEMAMLISHTDVDIKELNDCLMCFMEVFWRCRQSGYIDLASLWRSITWYVSEDLPLIPKQVSV